MSSYQADPNTAGTPLTSAEAEMLLSQGAKSLTRDERALEHLLTRLPVTLRVHREAVNGLSSQVDSSRRVAKGGMTSSLSPRDAVRYLSATDIDALLASRLDVHTAPLLAAIDSLQAELASYRAKERGLFGGPGGK